MTDLNEVPESLVLIARVVEENRARLVRAMGPDGVGDYDFKHAQGAKLLADAAKSLSQEARQWGDLNRERAKARSVADNVALAVRYIASLNKGDRAIALQQIAASEQGRPDGLFIQLEPTS